MPYISSKYRPNIFEYFQAHIYIWLYYIYIHISACFYVFIDSCWFKCVYIRDLVWCSGLDFRPKVRNWRVFILWYWLWLSAPCVRGQKVVGVMGFKSMIDWRTESLFLRDEEEDAERKNGLMRWFYRSDFYILWCLLLAATRVGVEQS